jgi:hypothetical protein
VKQKDVVVGGEYVTKVGERRVRVKVVATREAPGKPTRFLVRRVEEQKLLPKGRTAAALYPVVEPLPAAHQRRLEAAAEGHSQDAEPTLPKGTL